MKIIVEKQSIIFIGLLYNYLANNKTILSKEKLEEFIKTITKNLEDSNIEYKIINEDVISKEEYGINYYKYYKEYALESFENIRLLYNNQPKELIVATLQDNALNKIRVSLSALEYKEKQKPGVTTFYSKEAELIRRTQQQVISNIREIEIEKQLIKINRIKK